MRKYKPATFQPTIRSDWGGILSYISNEEKASILEAIIKYPSFECNSRFWIETIKPELDLQYETFINLCEAKSRGVRNRWGKTSSTSLVDDYNRCNTDVIVSKSKSKSKDKSKEESKSEDRIILNNYGEFKNVCLEEKFFNQLKETYGIGKLNYAIEKLDTWLDNPKQEKKRNQNHRGYFKSNGWVWEGYSEAETSLKLFDNEPVKSIM